MIRYGTQFIRFDDIDAYDCARKLYYVLSDVGYDVIFHRVEGGNGFDYLFFGIKPNKAKYSATEQTSIKRLISACERNGMPQTMTKKPKLNLGIYDLVNIHHMNIDDDIIVELPEAAGIIIKNKDQLNDAYPYTDVGVVYKFPDQSCGV